ncbi:hypothetical protein PR003_g15505 [Phytophthora rubi]|uniref:Uncharacterized protein n=1 Tax=Phytophthora rubi TaxID=129364 RepID=A0A6A4EU21_9STRA|nr:hypothetical protein PR003_g15505 [Phytophthora rubi]
MRGRAMARPSCRLHDVGALGFLLVTTAGRWPPPPFFRFGSTVDAGNTKHG